MVEMNKAQLKSFVGLCKTWPTVRITRSASERDCLIFCNPVSGKRWKMNKKGTVAAL